MNYKELDKEVLKEMIVSNAEMKEVDLNKDYQNWYNMGVEKLAEIAEAIDATPMPEPEEKETEEPKAKGKVAIKGGTQTAREFILSHEKVTVEVPEDEVNDAKTITIIVCGVEFVYARGQMYDMPTPVAEVYRNNRSSNYKTKKKLKNQMTEIKSE